MPGTTGLDHAVELLERAIAYTRGVLGAVDEQRAPLSAPTPCEAWDLGRLLAHMEDALDAFTEGAEGSVSLAPRLPHVGRTDALRHKACALLGAWSTQRPASVTIGGQPVPTPVVAAAAALEITVHGWDLAQAVGRPAAIPDELAARLLEVAEVMVAEHDRGSSFAPALSLPRGTTAELRLLGFLGRSVSLSRAAGDAGAGPRLAS